MTITRIEQGARMSQAVVANGFVHLAGQVGRGDTVAEQTRTALADAEALLAQCGSDKRHLVSALICLADIADFDEMNSVWDPWIAGVGAPARATIEARLAGPQYRIEIVLVAAVAD